MGEIELGRAAEGAYGQHQRLFAGPSGVLSCIAKTADHGISHHGIPSPWWWYPAQLCSCWQQKCALAGCCTTPYFSLTQYAIHALVKAQCTKTQWSERDPTAHPIYTPATADSIASNQPRGEGAWPAFS